jgi:outer membrane receptor protein involved in Fe transport
MPIGIRTRPKVVLFAAVLLAAVTTGLVLPRMCLAQQQTYTSELRGIELSILYGYQFGGQMDLTTGGEAKADDQDAFSFQLSVPIQTPETQAELSYGHQSTTLLVQDYWQTNEKALFDVSVDYFQIGGLRGVRRGKAMPFGFGTLGATMFNPEGSSPGAEWRFSMTLGLGAKYYASERMGIRAQFGLLIPFEFETGSLYCGSGGCVGAVSGGTTFAQGNVSGGLIFIF